MCESLLDYIGKNPNSRLDKSPFENVNLFKTWVASKLINESPFRF